MRVEKPEPSESEPESREPQNPSLNALEILRETVRVLRYNAAGFALIDALLICPVSALLLSNSLVDPSVVQRITVRLFLLARSSGLPLRPFVKHSCQRLSEMALSAAVCFPLYATLLLLSKAAIVHSVDCAYSRKPFHPASFLFAIVAKIWRRLLSTYLCACAVIVASLTSFLVFLVAVCNACSLLGFSSDSIVYPALAVGLVFSVLFANVIMICNVAVLISVIEEVSGPRALLRSGDLIRGPGQTQVGLFIFLGSTIGMALVEGLFEHRLKTLSYGDGSSRMWEAPLLVLMHSFVVLLDSMMSAVFYFSCRSSSGVGELGGGESRSLALALAPFWNP